MWPKKFLPGGTSGGPSGDRDGDVEGRVTRARDRGWAGLCGPHAAGPASSPDGFKNIMPSLQNKLEREYSTIPRVLPMSDARTDTKLPRPYGLFFSPERVGTNVLPRGLPRPGVFREPRADDPQPHRTARMVPKRTIWPSKPETVHTMTAPVHGQSWQEGSPSLEARLGLPWGGERRPGRGTRGLLGGSRGICRGLGA